MVGSSPNHPDDGNEAAVAANRTGGGDGGDEANRHRGPPEVAGERGDGLVGARQWELVEEATIKRKQDKGASNIICRSGLWVCKP